MNENTNTNIVGERLNTVLMLRNIKQKELASFLKVPDNTISYFCSGKRIPNTQQLIQIALFLNISADYLLGLSDVQSSEADVKSVCDYLGLSELAVNRIKKLTVPIHKSDMHKVNDNELDSYMDNYRIELNDLAYLRSKNRSVLNKILESKSFGKLFIRCLSMEDLSNEYLNELKLSKNNATKQPSKKASEIIDKLQMMRYFAASEWDKLSDLFDVTKRDDSTNG